MDTRIRWICILVGSTVGGLVPEAWGASAFGLASLVFGAFGALAGIWVAARLSGSL